MFQLTVPLEGEFFGVDFNPAADRLRIVSDLGQNLRHDVNENGMTTIDGPLSYSPPMPAAGITMAAYTNNDLSDQTGTTLFDTDLDQVAVQAPANNGSLSATGALGHDVVPAGGFDIYSTLDDDGVTSSVVGLATLKAEGHPRAIYRVNLLSGRASEIGSLKRNTPVVDIAVPLGQGRQDGWVRLPVSELCTITSCTTGWNSRLLLPAAAALVGAVAAGSIAVAVNQEDDDAPIGEGPVREPVASIASAAGLDVEAQLVDHTWGLEIELQGTGFQEGARYRVVVLDRSGQTYPSGEFVGVGDVEMDCALSSAVLRADAVAFRVVGSAGRTVVRGDLDT